MHKKGINKRPTKFVQELSRKTDNSKRTKALKQIAITIVVFIVLIFSLSFYAVTKHNSIRETVASNPKTISAEVINISRGKGIHSATYEFTAYGKKYTGTTFQKYKGNKGDIICVKYSTIKPEVNIYCEDTTPETFLDDVLILTLELTGLIIVILSIYLCFLKLKKPKKSIWDS